MVAMGLGYSILNQRPRISETYTGERTVILEIADPAPSLHVVTSTLSRSGTTAKAQAVTAAARSILAEAAPE